MAKRFLHSIIFSSKSNTRERKLFGGNLTENAILLGTVDVPVRQGNDICFYSCLLISKLNDSEDHKPETVKVLIDVEGFLIKDKNNVGKIKFPLLDLTYVWVHPNDPHILGVIFSDKDPEKVKRSHKFIAFRMASKAKTFACNLQHFYCDYMDGIHQKLSIVSINYRNSFQSSDVLSTSSSVDIDLPPRSPGFGATIKSIPENLVGSSKVIKESPSSAPAREDQDDVFCPRKPSHLTGNDIASQILRSRYQSLLPKRSISATECLRFKSALLEEHRRVSTSNVNNQ